MFFTIPSFFFLLTIHAGGWAAIHSWANYEALSKISPVTDPTVAVAAAFQQAPYTFVLSGIFLMLSMQLFSFGILSMQSKRYFEEIFQLGTAIYTTTQRSHRQP